MVSKIKAETIIAECLDELYRNSTPSINWTMVEFLYGNTEVPFYEKHKISEEKYEKIVSKYKKNVGNNSGLAMTLLDYAPTVEYK